MIQSEIVVCLPRPAFAVDETIGSVDVAIALCEADRDVETAEASVSVWG